MENLNPYTRHPRDFERLKSEKERLDTFVLTPGWPVVFIKREDCAQAGFFFLQDGDKVQCAFCRGVAGEWEPGDQPLSEHRRHFPRCPFVCNLPVGNIPIGQEEEAAQQRERDEMMGVDVCGPFQPQPRTSSAASATESSSVRGAQPIGTNNADDFAGLAIKTCGNGPVHTSLVTHHTRIKTFVNWPSTTGQSADIMSDAGFFYIGRSDHVKCFYCDGGLRNWEESDDPWLEHARWFPNCTYVILNKGESFVKTVNEEKPPVIPSKYKTKPATICRQPRRVSVQELHDLIGTPIVQAALDIGVEVEKVKGALQRKIQQTGHPFMTTEALLEAVLGRDAEYDSDADSDIEADRDEDENSRPTTRVRHCAGNSGPAFTPGLSSVEASSSSAEHSSGDEETTNETNENVVKAPVSRCVSGDSGIVSLCGNGNGNGSTSGDEDTNHQSDAMSDKSSESESEKLEEEVRKLREARQCKICMDNEVGVVFLPCGHLVSCVRCATAVSTCAVCRTPIKAHVRTYLS